MERANLIDHDNREEFAAPQTYDREQADTAVAFYTALAQETGGPLQELACGTGRLSIPIARLGFSVTGLDLMRTQVYDHVAQIVYWTTCRRWREGEHEHTSVTRITARYTFPQELAALLHYNGWSIIRQYVDWNLEPLTAASPSIIVVCRRRALANKRGPADAPPRGKRA